MADTSVDDQAAEIAEGDGPSKRRFSGKKLIIFAGVVGHFGFNH